jgi:hypothetical protein
MEEIYLLTERALSEGQDRVQIHVFPFRLTEANLRAHAGSAWESYWRGMKPAYDVFASTHVPPQIGICGQDYAVGAVPGAAPVCPDQTVAADLYAPGADELFERVAPERVAKVIKAARFFRARARWAGKHGRKVANNRALIRRTQHVATCNPGLASCRKFMALHQRKAELEAAGRVAAAPTGATAYH